MKKKEAKLKLPVKKSLTLTLLILSIFEAACIIIQAAFLAKAIVGLFDKNFDNVVRDSVLFLIGFIFRIVFLHLQQYFTENHAIKFETELRRKLLQSYFDLGPDFTSREGSGKLVTLAIDGIGKVKQYFELNVSKQIRGAIIPTLVVIFIFYTDYVSALMIISVIPVIVIFMILLGINARDMANRQYKKYRALSNNFIDTIRGVETLKFLGVSKNYLPIMEKKNREYRQSTMKTLSVAFLNSFALDFLTTIAIALLAVRLGILLLDGSTFLLPSLTVLIIAPEFFLPMKQAATDYHATLDGQMAYEDINRMIVDNEKNKSQKSSIENVESIKLQNVGLIKDDKKILDNITLSINKGEKICLVGQSGSGKTSLISLLSGFNEQSEGEILINDEVIEKYETLPLGDVKKGSRIEIRDEDKILGDGEIGEIVIIGNTVSSGYYKNPIQTEKSFFITENNERAYKTGDLGFYKNGQLFFSNRKDFQVKLNGYRIELGDIESNLLNVDGVISCCALPNYDSDNKVKSITAFVVSNDIKDEKEYTKFLKEELKKYIPVYMIPKKIKFLEKLPMNNNGKVDRKELKRILENK